MKRRTLIASLGSLAAGSALTVGSGAFTSVSADRTVSVETTGDRDSLLRLVPLGEGDRSVLGGINGQVEFRFPGAERQASNPDLGLGVDSVYEFDRDTDGSGSTSATEGLLRIENLGTQPVDVYSRVSTQTELEIELYDVSDPDRTALRDEPAELGVGDSVDVGFRIITFGADIGTFDETLTIIAEATDS